MKKTMHILLSLAFLSLAQNSKAAQKEICVVLGCSSSSEPIEIDAIFSHEDYSVSKVGYLPQSQHWLSVRNTQKNLDIMISSAKENNEPFILYASKDFVPLALHAAAQNPTAIKKLILVNSTRFSNPDYLLGTEYPVSGVAKNIPSTTPILMINTNESATPNASVIAYALARGNLSRTIHWLESVEAQQKPDIITNAIKNVSAASAYYPQAQHQKAFYNLKTEEKKTWYLNTFLKTSFFGSLSGLFVYLLHRMDILETVLEKISFNK